MPIHSVLITNEAGMLLFAKYYDFRITDDQKAEWERSVYRQTRACWKEAFMGNQFFVEGGVSDLVVFITGSDEYDEIILCDLVCVVCDLIQSACDKKASESALLHSEAYGKFCVLLDEMIAGGHVERLDVDTIEKLAKLKPLT